MLQLKVYLSLGGVQMHPIFQSKVARKAAMPLILLYYENHAIDHFHEFILGRRDFSILPLGTSLI